MSTKMNEPENCTFCGYYLTTLDKYAGSRCVDPAHWQAAGMLAAHDFYPMARIAAGANAELDQRSNNMPPQPLFAE